MPAILDECLGAITHSLTRHKKRVENNLVFLSQAARFIPPGDRTPRIQQDLALFTEMAAKSGDAGSQFNLGKLFLAKVDVHTEVFDQNDMDNIKNAKHWYRMAAQQGLREARESLKHLEVFDC